MPQTLAQKLRIQSGDTLLTLHAPRDFESKLEGLPDGVTVTARGKRWSQVHWFVQNRARLEEELAGVLDKVQGDTICWIYYPKGSSKMQTDLTRDKGWEALQQTPGLQWLTLISFDETWSVFGFRQKNEKDEARERKASAEKAASANPLDAYIDREKKTVRTPEDLAEVLKDRAELAGYFNKLAYSHRKEYVEWIVTAKKPETRAARVAGTIERLEKGWKNPRNL